MSDQTAILNSILKQAEIELNQSSHLMELFSEESDGSTDFSDADSSAIETLILVLQYRLDTQNLLIQLGRLQHYLLQILGIESKQSFETKMERLSHALGSDELKHVLSMMNHLVDSLSRTLAQQSKSTLGNRVVLKSTKSDSLLNIINKSLSHQKSFAVKMTELKLVLENIPGAPHQGIVHDHIAALQGPISRFQQALQHGLVLSGGLYQQLEKKTQLQYQVPDTLLQPSQVFQHGMTSPELQRLFKPTLGPSETQRLEERATAKRLGHFFNH